MKETYSNAGSRIRCLREKKHYTRERLAEMADISSKFLYEIEHGVKGFSADTLLKLSKALGTDANFILVGTDKETCEDELENLCSQLDDTQRKYITNILKLVLELPDMYISKHTSNH